MAYVSRVRRRSTRDSPQALNPIAAAVASFFVGFHFLLLVMLAYPVPLSAAPLGRADVGDCPVPSGGVAVGPNEMGYCMADGAL
jgi:hypothetical protein